MIAANLQRQIVSQRETKEMKPNHVNIFLNSIEVIFARSLNLGKLLSVSIFGRYDTDKLKMNRKSSSPSVVNNVNSFFSQNRCISGIIHSQFFFFFSFWLQNYKQNRNYGIFSSNATKAKTKKNKIERTGIPELICVYYLSEFNELFWIDFFHSPSLKLPFATMVNECMEYVVILSFLVKYQPHCQYFYFHRMRHLQ